jgi:hypothetical protein
MESTVSVRGRVLICPQGSERGRSHAYFLTSVLIGSLSTQVPLQHRMWQVGLTHTCLQITSCAGVAYEIPDVFLGTLRCWVFHPIISTRRGSLLMNA